jgi:hypothetical protein
LFSFQYEQRSREYLNKISGSDKTPQCFCTFVPKQHPIFGYLTRLAYSVFYIFLFFCIFILFCQLLAEFALPVSAVVFAAALVDAAKRFGGINRGDHVLVARIHDAESSPA